MLVQSRDIVWHVFHTILILIQVHAYIYIYIYRWYIQIHARVCAPDRIRAVHLIFCDVCLLHFDMHCVSHSYKHIHAGNRLEKRYSEPDKITNNIKEICIYTDTCIEMLIRLLILPE